MEKSLKNAISFYNSKSLPDFVFNGNWNTFLFFVPNEIFSKKFIDVILKIMNIENSNTVCILNIDENDSIFINRDTNRDDYYDKLKNGFSDTKIGWLYTVFSYIISSEVGEWCIYCERDNDIAIIALKNNESKIEEYEVCFSKIQAFPFLDVVDGGREAHFPFDKLVPTWKEELGRNYIHRNDDKI